MTLTCGGTGPLADKHTQYLVESSIYILLFLKRTQIQPRLGNVSGWPSGSPISWLTHQLCSVQVWAGLRCGSVKKEENPVPAQVCIEPGLTQPGPKVKGWLQGLPSERKSLGNEEAMATLYHRL